MSVSAPPRGRVSRPAGVPKPPSKVPKTLGMLATLAVLLLCVWAIDAPWSRLAEAPGVLGDYLRLMSQ